MKAYNLDLVRDYKFSYPVEPIAIERVAEALETVHDPAQRELLLWLQAKSMRPFGLQELTRDLLLQFPERIGTPTSLRLASQDAYSIEDCAAVWLEMEGERPVPRASKLPSWALDDVPATPFAFGLDEAEVDLLWRLEESSTYESFRKETAASIIRKITPEAVWSSRAESALRRLPTIFLQMCNDLPGLRMDETAALLKEIQNAFERSGVKKMFSRTIAAHLVEVGQDISEGSLARRLRRLGVASRTIRIKERTAKGYHLEDFLNTFARFEAGSIPFRGVGSFHDPIAAAVAMMEREAQESTSTANDNVSQVHRELDFAWSARLPRCFVGIALPEAVAAFTSRVNAQAGRWRTVIVPTEPNDRDFWTAHADAYGISYDKAVSCAELRRRVENIVARVGLGILYQRAHLLLRAGATAERWLNWIRGLIERDIACAFFATPASIEEFMKTLAPQMEQWLGMPPTVKLGWKWNKDDLMSVAVDRFPEFDRDLITLIVGAARQGEAVAPCPPALKSVAHIGERARWLAKGEAVIKSTHVMEAIASMLPGVSVPRVAAIPSPVATERRSAIEPLVVERNRVDELVVSQ